MTTSNIKYQNGKIYKIECLSGEPEDIYIGSTTNKLLSERMATHRNDYKRYNNGLFHNLSSFRLFEKYGVENCIITLIENCSCSCRDELTAREGFHIRNNKCVNKNIAGRDKKAY
jgi:hypothetical protein